ncbi:MAG: glycosyltransferase family 4 protein [Melioribacteraceae bacterium]|nr:glycosyltransferase family 4 protein [Melioribacteraceae bacterium]
MKILHISPKLPYPTNDGGKIAIYGNLKYLKERGHEIYFVAYKKDSDLNKCIPHLETLADIDVLEVDTENSILGGILNLFSKVPYNVSKYHSQELKFHIISLFKKKKFDIVIIENLHMGYIVDTIKSISSIPVVLRQHNLEMKIMKRFSEAEKNPLLKFYSILQYKKFIKYEPELCEKFDKVVMITDHDKKEILELSNNIKSTTIPAGVKKDLLTIEIKEKEPYSLFHIGHLDWFPNLDAIKYFLNEILPQIVKKEPRTKFYIYGGMLPNGVVIPELVKENVIQKGFVDDLWSDIADKQLAVVPLRIGSGMRLKIVELLAAGHNILSTSIGCEGINVEDKKHLLIADNKNEFAQIALDFFNGKYNSEAMIQNGRKLIEDNYIWEKIAERFEQTFQKLISENKNK